MLMYSGKAGAHTIYILYLSLTKDNNIYQIRILILIYKYKQKKNYGFSNDEFN